MHVFFFNTRYVPEGHGGPAFSVRFLAEQLVREGDKATVFCRSTRPGVTHQVLEGVDVVRVGLEIQNSALASVLRQALDHFKPEVLHTNYLRGIPFEMITALIRARRLRTVHTLREYSFICRKPSPSVHGQVCLRQCRACAAGTRAERELAAEVAAVVGVSRFILERHTRFGLFAQTPMKQVIHNSYEPPAQVGVSENKDVTESCQDEMGPAGHGPLRLGFLGRLEPDKGVEYLLTTLLRRLPQESWTLEVAGKGAPDYEAWLRREYRDPRITFMGFAGPSDLFVGIDLLVVPSLWEEPLARVVIEAYAFGVPVLAAKRGGLPELVEEGRTGLLFEPSDQESLTQMLQDLITNREKVGAMRLPARAKWASQFTPAAILTQYREVYQG